MAALHRRAGHPGIHLTIDFLPPSIFNHNSVLRRRANQSWRIISFSKIR
jgi:hypothetical protein